MQTGLHSREHTQKTQIYTHHKVAIVRNPCSATATSRLAGNPSERPGHHHAVCSRCQLCTIISARPRFSSNFMSRMSRAVGARAASARAGEFVSTTFTGADGRSKWAPLFPADHDLSYKVFPLLGPKGSAFARGATTAVDPTRVRPLNAMEDKLRGPGWSDTIS